MLPEGIIHNLMIPEVLKENKKMFTALMQLSSLVTSSSISIDFELATVTPNYLLFHFW